MIKHWDELAEIQALLNNDLQKYLQDISRTSAPITAWRRARVLSIKIQKEMREFRRLSKVVELKIKQEHKEQANEKK